MTKGPTSYPTTFAPKSGNAFVSVLGQGSIANSRHSQPNRGSKKATSFAKRLFDHFFADENNMPDGSKANDVTQSAIAWAHRSGFTAAEIEEFEYMLGMVALKHVPNSSLGALTSLDEGSFGKIYRASYKKNTVAVKVLEATAAKPTSCIRGRMRELQVRWRLNSLHITTCVSIFVYQHFLYVRMFVHVCMSHHLYVCIDCEQRT